ncbi:MAG: hypothetical protein IPN76_33400 [Saprospiraceae bacterium]|nr:hypothetical protein [Saprospiraceae bacterium]
MKKSIALLLSLVLGHSLFCQNLDLRVGDPDWWESSWEAGTIDAAVFTVEPKGIYTEIGMYLTISADGYWYEKQDTLEIAFDFNLPKGSIIHDSWLWIGDDIIKADIRDRWSAIQTYEEIVDRRRDPSILFVKPEGGYQLRIYPLAGDESRTVKITYLAPTRWSSSSVSTLLPINLLAPSYLKNGNIKVITFPNAEWPNPKLSDNLVPVFEPATDPLWGDYLVADIDWDEITEPAVFEVDAPWNDGVFASKLDDGDDHFYQLAFQPTNLPQTNTPRKLAFLFDHQSNNASFGSANLFNFIKQALPNLLTADDAFNMFFTRNNFEVERLSQDWISGDPAMTQQVLDPLGNPVADAADIERLFFDAYDFIANHGGSADIVLFSSSAEYYPWWNNSIVETLLNGASNLDITIHVVNFQDLNTYYENSGNTSIPIPQHDFIYKALTAQTGGIYAGKYQRTAYFGKTS